MSNFKHAGYDAAPRTLVYEMAVTVAACILGSLRPVTMEENVRQRFRVEFFSLIILFLILS